MAKTKRWLELEDIRKIYGQYARVYDRIFKRWFYPRQRHVIQSLQIAPGQRVLDVGVGTGFSLALYPRHAQVVGVDLSASMLHEARKKVQYQRLSHVTLMEMDAQHLAFADNAFDYVIAAFVISVVPDPIRVLAEMKRVTKPDGQLVLINHFLSQNKIIARLEQWLTPLCLRLGWRSDLPLDYLVQHADLHVNRQYALTKLDLWKVVYAINNK